MKLCDMKKIGNSGQFACDDTKDLGTPSENTERWIQNKLKYLSLPRMHN